MTRSCALLALVLLTAGSAALSAQPRPADEQNANETRDRVGRILDQYPPSLRQVLRCDPSLLAKPDYLATYPALAAYLAQHPEVTHNPTFFIGGQCGAGFRNTDSRSQAAISIE